MQGVSGIARADVMMGQLGRWEERGWSPVIRRLHRGQWQLQTQASVGNVFILVTTHVGGMLCSFVHYH